MCGSVVYRSVVYIQVHDLLENEFAEFRKKETLVRSNCSINGKRHKHKRVFKTSCGGV